MLPMLGPHTHTSLAQKTRATDPGCLPEGLVSGEGEAQNSGGPSSRQEGPPWAPFPHPSPRAPPGRACQPKGQCQAATPADMDPQQVGSGPPTACSEGMQPGEHKRLTSDARYEGSGRPPKVKSSCRFHSAQRQLTRGSMVNPVPGSRFLPQGRVAGKRRAPNPRRLSTEQEDPPPGHHFATLCGAHHPAASIGQRASARSPRLHIRTHSKRAADPDCLHQGQAAGRGGAL